MLLQKIRFAGALLPSRATCWFGLAIIIAASFMRQVYNFARAVLPVWGLSLGIWIGFIGAAIFAVRAAGWQSMRLNLALMLLVGSMATSLALSMELMEERMHILTYGLLGFMVARDLRSARSGVVLGGALAFCACVSCADELFQAVLPYRVGDVRDLFFDLVSSFLGILMHFALSEPISKASPATVRQNGGPHLELTTPGT